jgi:hypothetical protein
MTMQKLLFGSSKLIRIFNTGKQNYFEMKKVKKGFLCNLKVFIPDINKSIITKPTFFEIVFIQFLDMLKRLWKPT